MKRSQAWSILEAQHCKAAELKRVNEVTASLRNFLEREEK